MIVCTKCNDVLYVGTMPDNSHNIEYVLCLGCSHAKVMTITITTSEVINGSI